MVDVSQKIPLRIKKFITGIDAAILFAYKNTSTKNIFPAVKNIQG
jgi:hypothetical protein